MSKWFASLFRSKDSVDSGEMSRRLKEAEEARFGMRSQYWIIDKKHYEEKRLDTKFRESTTIQARYLAVEELRRPSILKELQFPIYQQLTSLYLKDNHINSVECLQFFHAPKLTNLDLKNNLITSIRALRKCSFTLIHLCVSNNPLAEATALSQIKFHKRQFNNITSSFSVDRCRWEMDLLKMAELSGVVKAESGKIKEAMLLRKENVFQQEAVFWKLGYRRLQGRS